MATWLLPVPVLPMISALSPSAMNFRVCSSKQAWRGSLGLKRQSKSMQREPLVQAGLLVASLGQARAAPVEFVLQDQREGLQEGLLGGSGPAGLRVLEGGGDARQAQLAQGAFDLIHVHGRSCGPGGWSTVQRRRCAGRPGEQVRVVIAAADQRVVLGQRELALERAASARSIGCQRLGDQLLGQRLDVAVAVARRRASPARRRVSTRRRG